MTTWRLLWWLGAIWTFPNTIIALAFFYLLGRVSYTRTSPYWPYPKVYTVREGTLLDRLWKAWKIAGASGGLTTVIRPYWMGTDSANYLNYPNEPMRTLKHESRHSAQAMVFGPLFWLAYVLAGLVEVVACRSFYKDNWFEADARKHEV